jgi:putative membrane protein
MNASDTGGSRFISYARQVMIRKLLLGIIAAAFTGSLSVAWAADTAGQKFIKEAIQGNLAEVAVGKLAQEKGKSDGVRSFGQMLATDHAAANQKATTIANTLGVTPPTEPSTKQKRTYDKLAKLSGDAFDREFAKAMVTDHKKDIKEFEKESKANDAAAVFAKETLPTLHKHLEAAQSLASGKTAMGMKH